MIVLAATATLVVLPALLVVITRDRPLEAEEEVVDLPDEDTHGAVDPQVAQDTGVPAAV